jgi:hypothetical protein
MTVNASIMEVVKEVIIPSARIQILSNGLMHVHVLTKNYFEMENSREILSARTALAEGKAYPILYTSEHVFVTPSQEVKQFVAAQERANTVKADGFVMKSFPQRLAARLYMKLNRPVVPTAFFSTEEEAIEWLLQFAD